MTPAELDAIAEEHIRDSGRCPRSGYHGYPASICSSVNDEIVHGIPGPRGLAEGDVVSIDCGAIVDGWHGDAALTVRARPGQPAAARAAGGLRAGPVARLAAAVPVAG